MFIIVLLLYYCPDEARLPAAEQSKPVGKSTIVLILSLLLYKRMKEYFPTAVALGSPSVYKTMIL